MTSGLAKRTFVQTTGSCGHTMPVKPYCQQGVGGLKALDLRANLSGLVARC